MSLIWRAPQIPAAITPVDAARFLGLSRSSAYRTRGSSKLPTVEGSDGKLVDGTYVRRTVEEELRARGFVPADSQGAEQARTELEQMRRERDTLRIVVRRMKAAEELHLDSIADLVQDPAYDR